MTLKATNNPVPLSAVRDAARAWWNLYTRGAGPDETRWTDPPEHLLHCMVRVLSRIGVPHERTALDFVAWAREHVAWSHHTFGPPHEVDRVAGVIAHLREEVDEAEAAPHDASEWADIIILATDAATRSGIMPEKLAEALAEKQRENRERSWPPWRGADPSQPIRHVEPGVTEPEPYPYTYTSAGAPVTSGGGDDGAR